MSEIAICCAQGEPPSPKTPRALAEGTPAAAAAGDAAAAAPPPAAPKTPELPRNASVLSCFGLGPAAASGAEDGGEEVESSKSSSDSDAPLPRGVVGLRNNGAPRACMHALLQASARLHAQALYLLRSLPAHEGRG